MVLVVKNPPANAEDIRDKGSIPGWGRCPGGYGNPVQYPCLGNAMNRRAFGILPIGSQRVKHDGSDLAQIHTWIPVKLKRFENGRKIVSMSISWLTLSYIFAKCYIGRNLAKCVRDLCIISYTICEIYNYLKKSFNKKEVQDWYIDC